MGPADTVLCVSNRKFIGEVMDLKMKTRALTAVAIVSCCCIDKMASHKIRR